MQSIHEPVLPDEVLHWLQPQPGQLFVDGTLGGGGHTRMLAQAVGASGQVIALDRDRQAVARMQAEQSALPIRAFHANYCELPQLLDELEVDLVHGVLIDLGLSSDQLEDASRGFSYTAQGTLDMRFDLQQDEPAWQWLARVEEKELADTIYKYGEERLSRRIAKTIVECRRQRPIETAEQLAAIVSRCVPRSKGHGIHPATRTFQAIRIAVNDELGSLERGLKSIPDRLKPGGRLVIISFHSLEDRLVKYAFRGDERLKVLTKKPVRPGESEQQRNKRSRSSKLRAAERIGNK